MSMTMMAFLRPPENDMHVAFKWAFKTALTFVPRGGGGGGTMMLLDVYHKVHPIPASLSSELHRTVGSKSIFALTVSTCTCSKGRESFGGWERSISLSCIETAVTSTFVLPNVVLLRRAYYHAWCGLLKAGHAGSQSFEN